MNKHNNWHIKLLFLLGLIISPVYALEYEVLISSQDSLSIDNSEVDKRSFEDLKSKYDDEAFIYERPVNTSGWWTRFKQWLSDFIKDLFNFENRRDAERATEVALRVAAVLLFLAVVFFIVKAILNKEGRWVFGKSSDKTIIPVSDIEANIQAIDFKKLIRQAENAGNFRLAIRYYYLWLLKTLSFKEIIAYDVEKTNSDYRDEINAESIRSSFSYASYLYNYIWYGEFDVNEGQFKQAKLAFDAFIKEIDS
ncbi:MAG: DUF4129 domain-containing protein [Flavobacteriaceae bacterium]|nr:DUF4129 domain-containing protein [Flavobacteriaceae bacterium]NNK73082.1 DUF4129 domain-containing protein [Flavobacteriaceae bacterium]